MTALFPALQQEELLYSAVARYRDMMRLPSERAVLEEVFGRAAGIAVVDLPGRIEAFLAGLPPGHGYTAEEVVRRHTTLPYYLPFVARHQAEEAEQRLRTRGSTGIPDLLGIRASTVPAPTFLRFCPACAETDRSTAGAPYWRRVHQLPGVVVCPDHGIALWCSGARRTQGEGRHVFRSLGSAAPEAMRPIAADGPGARLLLEIAQDSRWLLAQAREPEGLDGLRRRYTRLLQAQGWMRSPRRIRITDLREAFLTWCGASLLNALGCDLRTRTGRPGASRIRSTAASARATSSASRAPQSTRAERLPIRRPGAGGPRATHGRSGTGASTSRGRAAAATASPRLGTPPAAAARPPGAAASSTVPTPPASAPGRSPPRRPIPAGTRAGGTPGASGCAGPHPARVRLPGG